MTFRVGIVGVGNIDSIHAGAYKDNPQVEIAEVQP